MIPVHVGIDLGTSSAKTVLLGVDGVVLATAQETYVVDRLLPTWAEQDPEMWWGAVTRSVSTALAAVPGVQPVSVGIAGQMHGGVVLDHNRQPLRPAIIWSDSRTAGMTDQWRRDVGDERTRAICGMPTSTGMLGVSLLWLRANEPAVWNRVAHVLMPKDYLRLRLTGELALEPTDAAGALLFNVHTGTPAAEILDLAGIPAEILPRAIRSLDVAGRITAEAAAATGLPVGVPVAAGGGDQSMAALALGIDSPTRAAIAISSGGTAFTRALDSFAVPREAHVLAAAHDGEHLAMGVVLAAGLAIDWLSGSLLGRDRAQLPSLMAQAAAVPPGAGGLLTMPHLGGMRTPRVDSSARASFVGLGFEHSGAHLARALVEGVSLALVGSLAGVADAGQPLTEIVISGGGARFGIWRQSLADISGLPVSISSDLEHPAIGAALAGAAAAGLDVQFDARARVSGRVHPRPEFADVYRDLAERHHALETFLATSKGYQS